MISKYSIILIPVIREQNYSSYRIGYEEKN